MIYIKQTLYLVRGIPGSGKTSFAKKMFGCPIFENDMYFVHAGKYMYNTEKRSNAIDWCMSMTEECLYYGLDVCVSNTFTKAAYIEAYVNIAKKNNANVVVYRMCGEFDNIHDVPQDIYDNMKNTFEPWPNEVFVYPNLNQDPLDPYLKPYIFCTKPDTSKI